MLGAGLGTAVAAVVGPTTLAGAATGSTPTSTPAPSDGSWNVKASGAAGNGTADDTAAIQAALNSGRAAGGGTVFFPPGRYRITAPLTVYPNLTLDGAGPNASVIQQATASAHGLTGTDLSWVSVRRLAIAGLSPATPNGGNGINFVLSKQGATTYVDIDNVSVSAFYDGIAIATPMVSRIRGRRLPAAPDGLQRPQRLRR